MNEFIARNGLISQNNSVITGSLRVSSSEANQLLIGDISAYYTSFGSVPNVTIGSGSSGGVLDIRNTSTSSPDTTNVGTIQFSVQSSAGNYTQTQLKSISAGGQSGGASGGGHLTFLTSIGETGAVPVERMRITNYGNVHIGAKVGIGTNDPITTLHAEGSIVGPVSSKYRSIIYANNTSTGGGYNNAIGLYAEVATIDGIAVYGNSTNSNGFGGYFQGRGYFSNNVIIDNSLLPGVLPADTGFRLDVSGSARITNNLTVTGSVTAASGLIGTGSSIEAVIYGLTPNLSIGMNDGSTGAVLDLRNTLGTSPAGSTLGTIQFSSYTTDSDYIVSPAGIRATTTTQASTGNTGGGNIAFWTADVGNGDSQSERMRVNSNGQVLIGVTSSLDTTSKLIISGSTVVTGSLIVTEPIIAKSGVQGIEGLVQAFSLGLQNIF